MYGKDSADSAIREMLAVALAYNKDPHVAPSVVAKGRGDLASKIVETAREYGIPIEENVQLAAILLMVEIGEEIPPDVFFIVAEIIAYLYSTSKG